MSTEDRNCVGRDLGKLLHKTSAARFQRVDHPFVVYDFVPHIDRRAVLIERALDDFNRAHDTGAETARFRQNNLHPADPLECPFSDLACRRFRARSARNSISAGCNSGAWRAPKTPKTLLTIPFAPRPALAY